MLNILLLLAGPSPFFNKEEYPFPKPLIEINGKTMIEHVLDNLNTIQEEKRFIFVINTEDCTKYHLDNIVKILTNHQCEIVYVEKKTQGAICSALLAIDLIDSNDPLIIANPDQLIDHNLNHLLLHFYEREADAGVAVFETIHPRWSYVRLNEKHEILEAAEKRTISKQAVAGFYYFSKGSDFVLASMKSIQKASHVGGVYYVAPVLNELILEGKNLIAYPLPTSRYHTFYSPQKIEEYQKNHSKSKEEHLYVVIPMAGAGSRFEKAGYALPKPFIDVDGKPMIAQVMDNLKIAHAKYILLVREEHIQKHPEIISWLETTYPVDIIPIDKLTEGTACTLLYAREQINNDVPLLIANCDQLIDMNIQDFIHDAFKRGLDGSILTFNDSKKDPKWSFAKINNRGFVIEVQEKKPISSHATVGIYFFSKGKDFVNSTIDMIARNDRINNEFYTCPTYNYVIAEGKKIGIYEIPFETMHGIGTPEDLQNYLKKNLCTASSH